MSGLPRFGRLNLGIFKLKITMAVSFSKPKAKTFRAKNRKYFVPTSQAIHFMQTPLGFQPFPMGYGHIPSC